MKKRSLNVLKKVFKLDEDDSYQICCCQIYITYKQIMVFHCTLCDSIYGSFIEFLRHILHQHFDEDTGNKQHILQDMMMFQRNSLFHSGNNVFDFGNRMGENITLTNEGICSEETTIESVDIFKDHIDVPIYNIEENKSLHLIDLEDEINTTKEEELKKISQINAGIFECDICHRVYEKDKWLRIHVRSHNNPDRKYKCDDCGFAFKAKSNLSAHIKRNHNLEEKKYICSQCSKRFHTRAELNRHEMTHTGESGYICSICGKTFIHSGALNRHCKRHSNSRPYICKICGKGFKTPYAFRNHTAVHLDERNYKCSICYKKFKQDNCLKQHLKLHANQKEYVCNVCQASFNQAAALNVHLKHSHKIL